MGVGFILIVNVIDKEKMPPVFKEIESNISALLQVNVHLYQQQGCLIDIASSSNNNQG